VDAGANVAAAVQEVQAEQNVFVTIAFTIVVGLLTIVTLGVAYLSLGQWFDGRQEKEDRERVATWDNAPDGSAKGKASKPAEDKEIVIARKYGQGLPKRDKSKGFGSGDLSTSTTTKPREF